VRAWAHLYRVNGGADPVYLSAMRHAELMEIWPKHKPADVPAEALDVNTGKHQPFEYDPKRYMPVPSKTRLFSTTEVAEATGATLRQLQRWSEMALLRPSFIGHARVFCSADIKRAKRILLLSRADVYPVVHRNLLDLPWKIVRVLNRPTLIGDVLMVPKHKRKKA
jgi:hypothetical protein